MVRIIPRDVWCDIPPNSTPRHIALPTLETWLHHGADGYSDVATANQYANYHIRHLGWDDVGYSFLIAEGQILEGRGHDGRGAHTLGRNHRSHGIVVCGDYRWTDPDDRDLDAVANLLRHGKTAGWWPGTIEGGHRDAPRAATTCPGDRLHRRIDDINAAATGTTPIPTPTGPNWAPKDDNVDDLVKGIQTSLNDANQRDRNGNKLKVDGAWGPLTQSALTNAFQGGGELPARVTITGTLSSR